MDASPYEPTQPSRLRLLLDHFSRIEDKRSPESVAHKLNEVLLVCVCATIAECDSFEAISDWGQAHLEFLRRFLPFHWGVPSGRWLNIMMNRIDPGLFAACFTDWVRACWPEPLDAIASDGKTCAAATIGPRDGPRCIWSPPSPPTAIWFSDRRRSTTKPTKRPRSLCCSRNSPPAAASKAPWSPSTPSPAILRSPNPSAMPEPTICSPSKAISRPCRPISRPPSRPPT